MPKAFLIQAATLAAAFCAPLSLHAQAQGTPGGATAVNLRPHELSGFFLRQSQAAFDAALGKPFQVMKLPDGTCARAYPLPDTHDYLVASIGCDKTRAPDAFGKAVMLQLTGDRPFGPTGFFGLRLGDGSEQVESALGKPGKISPEQDDNLNLWDYTQNNFTVEITAEHKLYSIQVLDQDTDPVPTPVGRLDTRVFAQAIQSGDIDRIAAMASGELECSRSGKTYGLQTGPGRKLLSDPHSPISACLQNAAKAILSLDPDMKGAENSIRFWETDKTGLVTKFPPSSPLKEVVYDDEAGSWRVYEVTFR